MVAIWRQVNNDKCRGEIFFARATNDAGQKWLGATDGERRGEKYFARAKNDVGQKWSGCYAPPMADVWAKNISPLQLDDWGCKGDCEHIDD